MQSKHLLVLGFAFGNTSPPFHDGDWMQLEALAYTPKPVADTADGTDHERAYPTSDVIHNVHGERAHRSSSIGNDANYGYTSLEPGNYRGIADERHGETRHYGNNTHQGRHDSQQFCLYVYSLL